MPLLFNSISYTGCVLSAVAVNVSNDGSATTFLGGLFKNVTVLTLRKIKLHLGLSLIIPPTGRKSVEQLGGIML